MIDEGHGRHQICQDDFVQKVWPLIGHHLKKKRPLEALSLFSQKVLLKKFSAHFKCKNISVWNKKLTCLATFHITLLDLHLKIDDLPT